MRYITSSLCLSLLLNTAAFADEYEDEWDHQGEVSELEDGTDNDYYLSYEDQGSSASTRDLSENNLVVEQKPYYPRWALYGDMLYWKACDSSNEWALRIDYSDPTNLIEKKYAFDFDWDFGFRLGVNYEVPWNELHLDVNWTRFYTSSTNTHEDLSILENITSFQNFAVKYYLNLLSTTVNNTGNPYAVSGTYKVEWDQIDLSVAKKLSFSKQFSLTPYGGVRFLINRYSLNMTRYFDYYGAVEVSQPPVNTSTMDLSNTFTAIGLMGGFLGNLEVGKGFGVFLAAGGFVGSAANKSKNIQYAYTGSTEPSYSRIITQPRDIELKTMIDIASGVEWEKSFLKNHLVLNLMAAYEFHVLFNTPGFIYDVNTSYQTTNPTTNFQLEGLTIRAGLQF